MRHLVTFITILTVSLCTTAQEPTDSLTRELQEIVVTARQPATRLVGSTLVSTISGSSLSNLGTALDVLAQLPMLQTDNGAVSVIGRSSLEVYIDGKPMHDNEELQQILSQDMKKVELLLAPGAAYGSTTDAVLKVTTRRNFIRGLSVTEMLQAQRRRKWSATDFLNLSYRNRGFDLFLSGSFNHDITLTKGVTTNTLTSGEANTLIGSSQHNTNKANAGTVRGGFNYSAGEQTFGAYYRFNPEKGDFENSGSEWTDLTPAIHRDILRGTKAHSHLVSAYYENRFAGRYLIHFDGDFRKSVAENSVDTEYPGSEISSVSSSDRRESSLWAGKLYVTFPLGRGEFAGGTQASRTKTTLDYRMHTPGIADYIPSSLTEAHQTQTALFASWSGRFGRASLTAGLRYEYSDYNFTVNGNTDNDSDRRDHILTPDISAGYEFDDRKMLTLSYKTSIIKPPYSQLTGSLNYVGQHEIEGGNPSLRDERMHDLQLFGMWGDFMMQTDCMRSLDTYAFVKQQYPAPTLQLIMHPVNINLTSLNIYLIWNKTIGRWTPNLTLGCYRQWLNLDGIRHDKPIFSYYFENTVTLPGGWNVTANATGQTQGDMHTNRFSRTPFTMDASIGKTFFGNALNVKLSATDIFNTASNDWTMNTYGVFTDRKVSYDRRGVMLNITYRFHPRESKYKGNAANQAEMNRL